jgi:hypothetical protein
MRRVARTRAAQRRPKYLPGKAESSRSGRLAGFTLSGSRDAELNRKLALYCALQIS